MGTLITLRLEKKIIRLQAESASEIKAALFDLLFHGLIRITEVGQTMNTATVTFSSRTSRPKMNVIVGGVAYALKAEGYRVLMSD